MDKNGGGLFSLTWERLPNAEVYDIYVKKKDHGDYALLSSVPDNAASGTQTFAVVDALEQAAKPQGIYYVRIIGRNTLTKGDLSAASEAEVEYNREFPPITGLHYDPETYILSWEEPAIPNATYSIHALKDGEQEYVLVCYVDNYSDRRVDILKEIRGSRLGFGTYQVKIIGRSDPLIGNIEKATPITIEYPRLTLPPITKVSLNDNTITWEIGYWESSIFYVHVKEAGQDDSEYEIVVVSEIYNGSRHALI
jgi:hypothetical protein